MHPHFHLSFDSGREPASYTSCLIPAKVLMKRGSRKSVFFLGLFQNLCYFSNNEDRVLCISPVLSHTRSHLILSDPVKYEVEVVSCFADKEIKIQRLGMGCLMNTASECKLGN